MTALTRKGWNQPATVTEEEARELTERIRASIEDTWKLLVEAHETKAWKALGYERWADYIANEFQRARSWSYKLLDQGEVIRAIEEASGVSTPVDIDQNTARDIKPLLPVVVEDIKLRIARGEVPEEAVLKTVTAARKLARPVVDPSDTPIANRLKKQPQDEVLGRALGSLNAAVVALSDFEFDDLTDTDRWVKEIERTLKRLRELRGRILNGGV